MMAQKKKSGGGMRAPRRSRKKKRDMGLFVGLGVVGLIVVISAAILLGGRKGSAEAKPKTEISETKPKKTGKLKRVSKAEKKQSDRAARRKKRASRKRGTKRTKRSKRGKSKSRSSSKKSSLKVEAIILDDSGERYALIDGRHVRAGNIVGGRRIVEVGSNSLQIEYHGKTYRVRIGQPLY